MLEANARRGSRVGNERLALLEANPKLGFSFPPAPRFRWWSAVEPHEYGDLDKGVRLNYTPAFLLALVAAYLFAAGELASGFFFLVAAMGLYNALKPDTTVDVI